jgi:kynurenine formamidase
MAGGQFTKLDVEAISPILFRGVLLDVAGAFEVDAVDAGCRVGADDLQRTADQAGITIHQGDAALVRLGWGSGERYGSDSYLGVEGQLPGIDVSGAQWLVEHGVALAGTDTIAFECLAPGDPLRPVHQILLRDNGVYIVENLALEALAAASITAFALVVAPLRFVGATGGAVRPIALVP